MPNSDPGLAAAEKLKGDALDVVVPNPPKILVEIFAGVGPRLNVDEDLGLVPKLKALDVVKVPNEKPL